MKKANSKQKRIKKKNLKTARKKKKGKEAKFGFYNHIK